MKKLLFKFFRRTAFWVLVVLISVAAYMVPVLADTNNPPQIQSCLLKHNCFPNSSGTAIPPAGTTAPPSNGQSNTTSTESSSTPSASDISSSDYNSWENDPERQNASFATKMLGDFVAGISWALNKAGIIQVDQLVFSKTPDALKANQVFATDSKGSSEFDAIAPIYYKLFALSWVFLVVVVVFMGLRIARGNSNPRSRASIGELMMNLGVGIFFMCFSWFIVYYATDWNSLLCQYIAPTNTTFSHSGSGDYFTSQVINLILVCMSIFINIMYLLRKFLLIGAVVIGPFVGLAYASGNKQALAIWLSETITNAFMPLSHALVFAIYFDLLGWSQKHNAGLMNKWFVPIVVIFFIIPVSSYFRKLFASYVGSKMGVSSESVAGGALGAVTGLAGAGALAASLVGGKAAGGLKNVVGSIAGKGNLSKGTGPGGSQGNSGAATLMKGSAGAIQRASSPDAIQTGIGQANGGASDSGAGSTLGSGGTLPTGIGTLQDHIGKGTASGSKVGRTVGATAFGMAGAVMDMGLAAATGGRKVSNFQGGLSKIGGSLGALPGRSIGGTAGAMTGSIKAMNAEREASKDGRRKISRTEAFQRAMGIKQSGGDSRSERGLNQKASRRTYFGTMAGAAVGLGQSGSQWVGNQASRGTRKSLERLGSLKER